MKGLITLLLLLATLRGSAQKPVWPGHESVFAKEKLDLPFLTVDSVFRTIDGKPYRYLHSGRKSMVYFGMYGCVPCMAELPAIVTVAAEHPEMNFIYTTFNEADTINKEFEHILGKEYRLPENFYRISMTELFIALQNLTICYPVKYLLDSSGTVRYMQYQDMKHFNGAEYPDYLSVNRAVIKTFE